MKFTINGLVKKHHFIKTPLSGRQLVIPDIHGCSQTFERLLNHISLTKEDQLILLGDFINRGPDNVGVLQLIFKLLKTGYAVYPLRGNHEQMALDAHHNRLHNPHLRPAPSLQKRRGLIDENKLLLPPYYDFFNSLPYYYELEDYILSHAGFNFDLEHPFEALQDMLWLRDVPNIPSSITKQLIRGHVSQYLDDIQLAIQEKRPLITLDNGCYKRSTEGKGNLLCLNLGNQELFVVKNVEG